MKSENIKKIYEEAYFFFKSFFFNLLEIISIIMILRMYVYTYYKSLLKFFLWKILHNAALSLAFNIDIYVKRNGNIVNKIQKIS